MSTNDENKGSIARPTNLAPTQGAFMSLYVKTIHRIAKDLVPATRTGDIFPVIAKYHREMDRVVTNATAGVRACVACRSGCSACCHVPMGVQAHEVLIVSSHISAHCSSGERIAVIARAKAHRDQVRSCKSWDEYDGLRLPCPLLCNGHCSVYAIRPEVCRSHHSNDATKCEQPYVPSNDLPAHYIPELRYRLFALMGAIDQSLVETGKDPLQYIFPLALHEALTDPTCLIRWKDGQQSFPENCREFDTDPSHYTPPFKRHGGFGIPLRRTL